MLTAEEARRLFAYDPETGILTWKISPSKKMKAGDVAGSKNVNGYIQVMVKGKFYRVHRIIILIVTGCWPPDKVDHINHVPDDNRLENLRCVTFCENSRNMKASGANSSGYTGVNWHKCAKKWRAYICVNYKHIQLGSFTDLDDAIAARDAANIKYGFHPNHGR